MADITTLANQDRPLQSEGVSALRKRVTVPATGIALGDNVQLYTVPVGAKWRVHSARLVVGGSLGAGATMQVRMNRGGTRTALTAASTAAAASAVDSDAVVDVPYDAVGGDVLELLSGGAAPTVAAVVTVELMVSHDSD